MKIKFMKRSALDDLKKSDLSKNIKYYKGGNGWLATKYNIDELFKTYTKVEFPDFKLIASEGTQNDYDNMKILYEALKELTLSQASDERIWAGLAHTYCWDYMQIRWPLTDKKEKQKDHVLNNYFFWNSTKAIFLNGLSRLWWYAKYTYDERFDNPYELTKYICDNDINGKIFYLLSCKFVSNPEIFKAIIIAIKEFEEENRKLSRDEFKQLVPYLNRVSGKIVFDTLSEQDINELVKKKLFKLVK